MSWSDVIADMFIRIKNAQVAGHAEVNVPMSRFKCEILKVMRREGFIENFVVEEKENKKKDIRVVLKYTSNGKPVITDISRESKPGVRKYISAGDIKPVLGGIGVAIISTSRGVMTDREAKKKNLGGELICKIW